MEIIDDFEREIAQTTPQGSENWQMLRAGRFTASEIWKLMVQPKTKEARERGDWSETSLTYIKEKVAEVLTGQPKPESYAYPLVYGKDLEPQAKEYFESQTGFVIEDCGFVPYTDHAGGSPDGLIGEHAGIEIKCPYNSANQLDYLELTEGELLNEFPEYYWQVHANLLFTGRKLWYFVTYDPRYKRDDFKMKVLEVHKDDLAESIIHEKIKKAIETKLKMIAELTK